MRPEKYAACTTDGPDIQPFSLLGLLQGCFCRWGGGVRYAIPMHILFNGVSYLIMGWIESTLALNAPLFCLLGFVAVGVSVWLFRRDTVAKTAP